MVSCPRFFLGLYIIKKFRLNTFAFLGRIKLNYELYLIIRNGGKKSGNNENRGELSKVISEVKLVDEINDIRPWGRATGGPQTCQ